MGKNIRKMVETGVLDADAAKLLKPEVQAKVEAMSDQEIDTIIKFKLDVSGREPWEPDEDGSIF